MRMTTREKSMLLVLLVLAACAVFYNYDYLPMDKKIQDGEVEIARLEAELQKLELWEIESAQTEAKIAEIQAELDGWVKEAKAVSDIPLAIRFFEGHAASRNITLRSLRLGSGSASLAFQAPSFETTRAFLMDMEKMLAFEITRASYTMPSARTLDGTFELKLHVGPADTEIAPPAGTRTNPFVR